MTITNKKHYIHIYNNKKKGVAHMSIETAGIKRHITDRHIHTQSNSTNNNTITSMEIKRHSPVS